MMSSIMILEKMLLNWANRLIQHAHAHAHAQKVWLNLK